MKGYGFVSAALVLAAIAAGCAGGGSSSTGGVPQAGSASGSAQFTIVVPARAPSDTARQLKYISPSTKSATIAINGSTTVQTVNVTPGSPGCTTVPAGTTCVVNVTAPVGNDTFTVTMYDQLNAAGNVLGSGTVTAAINAGVAFNVNITPGGNVAKLFVSATAGAAPNTATIAAVAQDPAGNTIVGPFATAVTLAASGGVTLSGTTLASSSATVSASGSGAITASAGSQSAGAQLPLTTLQTFPLPAASSGPFVMGRGPDGNIYFNELGPNVFLGTGGTFVTGSLGRIARVTPAGVLTEFPLPTAVSGPVGMAAGPDGNMWFGELPINKIANISTSGQVTEFPLPAATPNAFTGLSSRGPRNTTVGPDGAIWFVEILGRQIGRITTAGQISEFPLPKPSGQPRGTPNAITAGPDGALWFSENQGRIGRITTAGAITEFTLPNTSAFPRFIASGSDGNVWFSELGSTFVSGVNTPINAGIGKISPAGQITEYRSASVYDAFDSMTLGPDGNIWFGNFNGSLGKITPNGQITLYPLAPVFATSPNGLVFANDGSLWFDDQNANTYGRLAFGAGWAPLPPSLAMSTAGQAATALITLAETGNSGPFTVSSAPASVCTVGPPPGLSGNSYLVTGITTGKCSVTITDAKNRIAVVPVDVSAASVTLQSHARSLDGMVIR